MKFLIIFLSLGLSFSQAEEPKPETAGKKIELEEVEVIEAVTTAKPENSSEKSKASKEPVAEQPDSKERIITEPVAVEVTETEVVSVVDAGTGVSAEVGLKYVCDGGRSYTFYQPGQDPNYLCELDAGHTEQAPDWYALNDASFCKNKIEELISIYNCTKEEIK